MSKGRCFPNLNYSSDKLGRKMFKQVLHHCFHLTNLTEGRDLSRAGAEGGMSAWDVRSQRELTCKTACWSHKNTQLSDQWQTLLMLHTEIQEKRVTQS